MLAVLKIPMIYLGAVVWYAIRAEPRPETGPDELGSARTARPVRLGRLEAQSAAEPALAWAAAAPPAKNRA